MIVRRFNSIVGHFQLSSERERSDHASDKSDRRSLSLSSRRDSSDRRSDECDHARLRAVRYDDGVPPPLFVLPGIGADERLFAAQRAVRDVRSINWVLPADPRESLARYAARLAGELRVTDPFDLGGSSFGGMVALELARHLSPRHVFLFGSCRSSDAVSLLLRALHPLAAMSPDRLLHPPRMLQPLIARWFGATSPAHIELFAQMLAATPPAFIRWAARAVFSWPGVAELPMPVYHVHGDHDRLIPVDRVKPDRVIAGAGHLLNLTHGDAVNDFIARVASS
ncbi:MAG TPA: alpha/beta fold hydrolase [Thermoanaerobaculia bacterium]|nr:alpha/beta fold hydrolase [Thermoanaerobaculia bacterium]